MWTIYIPVIWGHCGIFSALPETGESKVIQLNIPLKYTQPSIHQTQYRTEETSFIYQLKRWQVCPLVLDSCEKRIRLIDQLHFHLMPASQYSPRKTPSAEKWWLLQGCPFKVLIAVLQQVFCSFFSAVKQFSILMKMITITFFAWSYGIKSQQLQRTDFSP